MTIEDTDFYRRQLFEDHYVCVMDRDNPLAERRLDLAAYTSAPHALVTYGGNWRSFYLRELEGMQMSLNNVLKIPSPGNLQNLLLGTDLISTIPKRIAAMLPKEFVVLPCPCPAPFAINLLLDAAPAPFANAHLAAPTGGENHQRGLSLPDTDM